MVRVFKKRLKNQKGFTLVELIVVIAILGILSGLAIPRVAGFQADAKAKADAANIAMIKNAIEIALANGDLDFASDGNSLVAPGSSQPLNMDGIKNIIVPKYLNEMPTPKSSGTKFNITVNNKIISVSSGN